MRKFVALIMIFCCFCLVGCSSVKGPDVTCSAHKIIEDLSTLADGKCKDMYNEKIIRISGEITSKGFNPQGYLMLGLQDKFGQSHSWYTVVSFSEISEVTKGKKLNIGDLIVAQGIGEFKITDRRDRVVIVWDSKFVE